MPAVELAQVWVPLMPEASRLAEGVKKIGADAERVFGRATKTMGAQMASNFNVNSRKIVDSLRDIEKFTTSAAKAKKADADAAGRLELAEKRLAAVKANAKATDLQRATATEGVARAQRAQELTAANLTKVTKQLEAAQKTQTRAQEALKKSSSEFKLPLGARLAEQAERYGSDSGSRFAAGFKRALGAGAAVAAGGGFLAAAKQVIDLGVGMESNLNRLQGVTQASAGEMANAAAVAKQLGADTTIVGASAADAAAAMLELAKGGLTMQQALAAAPGTLRLAAAAQIDAAAAAESQATILNAFQLMPDQADRVADALANVASAAQGEVPDFMQGLQQAAAVANGFNIPMEDTVAVLGLFAKAGIRGSDAGTSLKTMLTHLANPSDQASAAMGELGIQAHDLATGEFVGLPKLFEQVSAAAGRMRPDDFQRAAATLFGTDAIRGAMIAGTQGVETLRQMQEAVVVAGGASRMAAANMQGVPGALEKMSNAADSAKLALYDVMKPLLESSGNKAAEWLNSAAEAISGMGNSGALDALAGGWRDISGSVMDIAPVIGRVAAQFAQGAGGTVVAGWRALGLAMKVVEPPLRLVVSAFEAIPGLGTAVGAVLGAIYLKSKLAGPALSAAAQATSLWGKAFDGWRGPAKQAVDAMGSVTAATGTAEVAQRGWATRMRDIYRSTAEESGRFSRTLGASKAAMSGLQAAGSGLLGVLGGPWGVAAMGVGAAMSLIASKHAEAADKARQQREELEQLQGTLDKQTGAITQQSLDAVASRFTDEGTASRAKSYGLDPSLLTQAATGNQQAYGQIMDAATQRGVMPGLEQIKYTGAGGERITWDVLKTQIGAAGVTVEELTSALLRQGTAWDDVQGKLTAASADPSQALQLQGLIDRMPDVNESIITMAQNVNEASQQMKGGAENTRLLNETLNGTWQATEEGVARFQALGSTITSVPDGKTITVDVLSDAAEGTLTDLGYTVERLPNGVIKVSADSEEAQARLSELVRKVETTRAAVSVTILPPTPDQLQAASDAINRGLGSAAVRRSNGEVVGHGGRAAGGYVDSRGIINGPGSGRSDSILARVVGGRGGVVRVSNRESINTAASTRRNWPIIDAMNRGWSPSPDLLKTLTGMPRFADGGIVDYAESLAGTPYSQATRWDCCLIGSTLVYGPSGAKPIQELRPGDEVFVYADRRALVSRVTAAWQSITQPVFRVRTRNRAVVGSANHPFLRVVQTKRAFPVRRPVARWEALTRLRTRSALTQVELAGRAGISSATVCTLESGKRWPSESMRSKIARALAVDAELLEREAPGRVGEKTLSEWGVEWARLDELKVGDLVVQPRALQLNDEQHPHLPDGTPVTGDVAWLLGAIIGDGTVGPGGHKSSVLLCLFGRERERAIKIIKSTLGANCSRSSNHGISFSNASFVAALNDMGFNARGAKKKLPTGIWHWGEKLQRALLDGYCDADGHRPRDVSRHGERTYSSCSRRLIDEVRALHIMLGDRVSNVTTNHRKRPIVIKGVQIKNALPLHTFAVYLPGPTGYGEGALRSNHSGLAKWLDDNDFTASRILGITAEGTADTYDIEVEGNHNFIADGVVVHNSGTIARIVNQATGAGGDLMTTKNAEEWLAARGFVPGMGTSEDFSVGWYDRGPNPGDGHMAATLPGGINAEQGGRNGEFTVGAGAAGADSPQFDRHMHLPADALWPQGSGGGGGSAGGYGSSAAKASAVGKAQTDVTQAERNVAQKQARLSEVKADATAKDSQRIKAENDLLKAEEDLAEKKDKLAEARSKPVGTDSPGKTGPDGSGFGQDMLKGALSALGFDGETFSDPTNWGIFKFGTAAANIFGGVAKNWNWQGYANATDGGTDPGKPLRNMGPDPASLGIGDGGFSAGGGAGLGALQLPQVSDFLPPVGGGNSTTNNNHNSNNTTTNSGLNIYGPVTMNQPIQARPPERMNTRMAGLPKP